MGAVPTAIGKWHGLRGNLVIEAWNEEGLWLEMNGGDGSAVPNSRRHRTATLQHPALAS